MKSRLSRLIPVAVATAAIGASGIGVAQASQGADDPAGHIRHGHGRDDGPRHHRHHHHSRHHLSQGLDDRQVSDDHGSGGQGADDPVGDDHGTDG